MNTRMRLVAGLAAAGVAAAGAVAVAVPATAGAGPAGVTAAGIGARGHGHGWGHGDGSGMRGGAEMRDRAGMGPHDGDCWTADSVEPGTLTEEQAATLAAMAEEEKLAGDLYEAFADEHQLVIFDRIAVAEDRHLAAVRTLLDRYGLDDSTAGQAAGEFTTPEVQDRYGTLLAEGLTSESAALEVGRQVEEADVADLQEALSGLTAPDVQSVYEHLLAASRRHLAAFTTWSTR